MFVICVEILAKKQNQNLNFETIYLHIYLSFLFVYLKENYINLFYIGVCMVQRLTGGTCRNILVIVCR